MNEATRQKIDACTVTPIQRATATPALPHTIESIQHLRALAALGVVVFHALGLMEPYFGIQIAHKSLGAAGVDLFFIISGFIMWVTAIARDESPARFAWRRVVRIVPLYWLVTTFVLAVVTLKPSLMNSASRDPLHFVASYFFVAWPHPTVAGRYWPPVIPGWTLNYEMLFYLVVALSLFLPRLRRIPFILLVLAGLPLIGSLWHQTGAAAFYTNPILLEFLYGVGLGFLFTHGRGQGQRVSIALMVAGALLFFTAGLRGDEANRALWWALPLVLLVQGALHAPALAQGAPRAFVATRWRRVIFALPHAVHRLAADREAARWSAEVGRPAMGQRRIRLRIAGGGDRGGARVVLSGREADPRFRAPSAHARAGQGGRLARLGANRAAAILRTSYCC